MPKQSKEQYRPEMNAKDREEMEALAYLDHDKIAQGMKRLLSKGKEAKIAADALQFVQKE
jgi:hypothetical protein